MLILFFYGWLFDIVQKLTSVGLIDLVIEQMLELIHVLILIQVRSNNKMLRYDDDTFLKREGRCANLNKTFRF